MLQQVKVMLNVIKAMQLIEPMALVGKLDA
jgi:hypothetical protein